MIYSWDNPIRQSGAAGGETFYDFRLSGREWFEVRLSTRPVSSIRPGSSPLRSNDVLYKLQCLDYCSRLPSLVDFHDSSFGGNNTPQSAQKIDPDTWIDHPGPSSIVCSAGSKRLTISSTTLHRCEDVDWYRIPRWDGFDPASTGWAQMQITLSPPIPGVRLQLHREVEVGGITRVEHTGAIGNGGADGVSINANAHSLPLLLEVDGSTSETFDIVINYCITDSTFRGRARDAARARHGQNPFEFFETLRQLRFMDLSVPRSFGLPETSDVLKFNWPRDAAGRSMLGQIHLVHHTGGPLRLRASPMVPDASIRFGFSLQRGSLASFKLPEKSVALIEYSIDGVHWTEGGPVIPGSNLETLLPPPGGFARIRTLAADPQILALSQTPTLHLAFSTEPGSSYIIERSTDLEFWLRDPAFVIRGDGSTHSYPIFIGPDREFFRASEVFETGP